MNTIARRSLAKAAAAILPLILTGFATTLPINADEKTNVLANLAGYTAILEIELSTGREFETQRTLTSAEVESKQRELTVIRGLVTGGLMDLVREVRIGSKEVSAAIEELTTKLRDIADRAALLHSEVRTGHELKTQKALTAQELKTKREALREIRQEVSGAYVPFIIALRSAAQGGSANGGSSR